jgi:protein arginine kinase activator
VKCQKCGIREATAHLIKIAFGRREELFLCNECLEVEKNSANFEASIDQNTLNFLSGMLANAFFAPGSLSRNPPFQIPNISCTNCGETTEEFLKTGCVGCENCYNTFKQPLLIVLKKFHGHATHAGKIPTRLGSEIRMKKQLESLNAEMAEAVKTQNFEHAAEIRDVIREIKKDESNENPDGDAT